MDSKSADYLVNLTLDAALEAVHEPILPLTAAEMISLAKRLRDPANRQHCDLCENPFTHFVISENCVRYRCKDHLASP